MITMNRAILGLASAGVVLLVSGMMITSPRSTAEERIVVMIEPDQVTQPAKAALKVRLSSQHYDPDCALLSVRTYMENTSEHPLYIVSNDFSFVHGHPLGTGHWLACRKNVDELLLDLSHVTPTAEGYQYFRSEAGSYGFMPEVIEIGPNRFRYITYVFQFPLRLDYRISETEKMPVPQGNCKVRLRFGFGREPLETFSKREFKQSYTIEEWQQRIAKDWQEHAETEPVSVQFSK